VPLELRTSQYHKVTEQITRNTSTLYVFFPSFNLIFGGPLALAVTGGGWGGWLSLSKPSNTAADTGGLVASGDGTAAGKPYALLGGRYAEGKRPSGADIPYPSVWEPDAAGGECAPPGAGGEVAEGEGATPTAPTGCGVLYSAHLGQLRFVSVRLTFEMC